MNKDVIGTTENDYCDTETCFDLNKLGFPGIKVFTFLDGKMTCTRVHIYAVQQWLMTKGIYIFPKIYLYNDINLDNEISWECNIYIDTRHITTIGKSLTYQDALKLGIKEAIKFLKENQKTN